MFKSLAQNKKNKNGVDQSAHKNSSFLDLESQNNSENKANLSESTIQMAPNTMEHSEMHQMQGNPDIQTKLSIGSPNDEYEKEADQVADGIMRMTGESSSIQMKSSSNTSITHASENIAKGISRNEQSGQSLPEGIQMDMGNKIGANFSEVKIHTDSNAIRMNQELGAKAFTHGNNIFFNQKQYNPNNTEGKRLLVHELTHVIQQSNNSQSSISRKPAKPYIALKPFDLKKLDSELFWEDPLTQTTGEIGYGADKGSKMGTPSGDKTLPISATIFPRNTGFFEQSPTGKQRRKAFATLNPYTPPPAESPDPESLKASQKRKTYGPADRSQWRYDKIGLAMPAKRALVIGGIHGNELGALDLVKQLMVELADKKNPLARDFDTLVVPALNPWGIQKNKRYNQRKVDLNRNFPGITGFPPSKQNIPRQPEVNAIIKVINDFKPDRILVLHGIGDKNKGGIYADPVEGEARELACRMAVLSLGQSLAGGKFSAEINVKGNKVAQGVCNSRYPGSPPETTSQHASLGTYGSADPSVKGRGITVITHEVAGKQHLKAKGAGQSVETLMPGIREFLLDNSEEASVADNLLQQTVTESLMKGGASAEKLAKSIAKIVADRFKDLNTYYEKVWYRTLPVAKKKGLPSSLKIVSPYRSFKGQANIVKEQLKKKKITASSTLQEIKTALLDILTTRSMPGFSRHHWGTEIDIVSTESKLWKPGKSYEPLIPFLQKEARKFGFFHPYSNPVKSMQIKGFPNPSAPHYNEEPWHLSYAPISDVIQKEWINTFKGTKLDQLIEETAKAIATSKTNKQQIANIKSALKSIGIEQFQTNVSPSK